MSDAPVALRFSPVGLFVADRGFLVASCRGVLGFIVTDQGRLGEAAPREAATQLADATLG